MVRLLFPLGGLGVVAVAGAGALTDPGALAPPLFALAAWLSAGTLALLLWARSAPPRPPLLLPPLPRRSGRPRPLSPGALPVRAVCYLDTGEMILLDAELLPPAD